MFDRTTTTFIRSLYWKNCFIFFYNVNCCFADNERFWWYTDLQNIVLHPLSVLCWNTDHLSGIRFITVAILFWRSSKEYFTRICILYLLARIRFAVYRRDVLLYPCALLYPCVRSVARRNSPVFYLSTSWSNLIFQPSIFQALSSVNSYNVKFDI